MRNTIDKHNRLYCRGYGPSQCKAERASAIKDARKLLRLLKGKGWSFNVFENLGWHYAAINGPLYVTGSEGHYFTMLSDGDKDPGSTPCEWSPPHRDFKDPNEAVKYAVEYASCVEAKRLKALTYAQNVVMDGANDIGR